MSEQSKKKKRVFIFMHFCNLEKSFDILLLFGEKSEF